MERRDFFVMLGRLSLFGVLAAVTAISIKKAETSAGSECTESVFCSKCRKLEGCEQPEALLQKNQDGTSQNS